MAHLGVFADMYKPGCPTGCKDEDLEGLPYNGKNTVCNLECLFWRVLGNDIVPRMML